MSIYSLLLLKCVVVWFIGNVCYGDIEKADIKMIAVHSPFVSASTNMCRARDVLPVILDTNSTGLITLSTFVSKLTKSAGIRTTRCLDNR